MELIEPETCTCEECKAMCDRPCWPSPDEARTLIELGYAKKMMNDYWARFGEDKGDIQIISPAHVGYEGQQAPFWPTGKCTLLTDESLCSIHDICKPIEGRMATCDDTQRNPPNWHLEVANMWDSPEGEAVVRLWNNAIQGFDV